MFLIRDSSPDDLEQIYAVAEHLDSVNLPADRGHIAKILDLSAKSFAGEVEPDRREYLFVLEERAENLADALPDARPDDLAGGRVIGTSIVHAHHGTRRSPHVFFEVLRDERYSETLDRYFVHEGLRLGYNYDGPTEIGGLILLPAYRGHPESLGKLLSYTRFLFMAMQRSVFRDWVLSELMPPLEPDGTSILWEHLGRRFTGLGYQEADLLSKDNKEFIRALFPHSIIYTSLLPKEVQAVIGQVGPNTRGVEKMLRRIGFKYARQIDPFDGGPHFVANTDEITLVKQARRYVARTIEGADGSRPWAIVATEGESRPFFRAMGTRVIPMEEDEALGITKDVQDALGIAVGDSVWAVMP